MPEIALTHLLVKQLILLISPFHGFTEIYYLVQHEVGYLYHLSNQSTL